jgi:DNA-binding PadR family transcriptional regulator
MVVGIHYKIIADFYKGMQRKDRFGLFIILLILYRKPRSFYQIMKRIKDRSGYHLPPSSVSAKMKYLEAKGYIKRGQSIVIDGRNQYPYSLTDKGREVIESFSKTLQSLTR